MHDDLKWLFGLILIFWLLWFIGGGPAKSEATDRVFLKAPAPVNSGETYGPSNLKDLLPGNSVSK
jgi:hypothetical protein